LVEEVEVRGRDEEGAALRDCSLDDLDCFLPCDGIHGDAKDAVHLAGEVIGEAWVQVVGREGCQGSNAAITGVTPAEVPDRRVPAKTR
jgi:hypothetical protein